MEIGFSQPIELPWLEQTAFLVASGRGPDQVRASLNDFLASKIPVPNESAHGSRYKRISILMRTWVLLKPKSHAFHHQALALIRALPSSEHLPLHYGMTITAYPFFAAVSENIGRLLTLQESFTIEHIQRRMRETLGQRDTVKYATTRVVRSLVDWKCLLQTKRSSYHATKPYSVSEPHLCVWLYEAVLRGKGASTMNADTLSGSKSLYPFNPPPLKHHPSRDSRLRITRSGPDGEVVELQSAK